MTLTLRDILNKLLRRQPTSASTARERLQLVLAHDRSDLSPELMDKMRREILEVVSKSGSPAIRKGIKAILFSSLSLEKQELIVY